jgi:hypothetical protein
MNFLKFSFCWFLYFRITILFPFVITEGGYTSVSHQFLHKKSITKPGIFPGFCNFFLHLMNELRLRERFCPSVDTSMSDLAEMKRNSFSDVSTSKCPGLPGGASPTRGSSARPPLLRRAVASVPSLFCRGVVTALFYGPRFESFQIFDWTPFPGILQGAATPASVYHLAAILGELSR